MVNIWFQFISPNYFRDVKTYLRTFHLPITESALAVTYLVGVFLRADPEVFRAWLEPLIAPTEAEARKSRRITSTPSRT